MARSPLGGAGPRRPLFVARRRRRRWPLVVVAALMVAGGGFGAAREVEPPWATGPTPPSVPEGQREAAPADDARDTPAAAAAGADEAEETEEAAPGTPALARHGDVSLWLPTARPLVVGFHEASFPAARELAPVGRLQANENPTKFDPPRDEGSGAEYLVLASRGRVHPATSAVDVVMVEEDEVLSPVDGVVTGVEDYRLYEQHEDVRVEIAPAAAPHLRVVLIHLHSPRVRPGDEVAAGRSPLAGGARSLPFGSHIDRYTEPDRHPHVHLEVKDPEEAREDERARDDGDADDGSVGSRADNGLGSSGDER